MSVKIELSQETGYRFAIRFGEGMPVVHSDLGPPLGSAAGPSPEHLLAAAVGNCLASSLLFSLKKFNQFPEPIRAVATATEGRNEKNRLRVQAIKVTLTLGVPASKLENLERVLATFEDFCTVTASVRGAVAVEVEVLDSEGKKLR
jgi:organic hydroperoxide reductase OsmC/OhrA